MLKKLFRFVLALVVLYLLLLIPDFTIKPMVKSSAKPFIWNQDSVWQQMEKQFNAAKLSDTNTVDEQVKIVQAQLDSCFQNILIQKPAITSALYQQWLQVFFNTATLIAARPKYTQGFIDRYRLYRKFIKHIASSWDIQSVSVRNGIYQLQYGMRAAVEEVLLQSNGFPFNPVFSVNDDATFTPATTIQNIQVQSGDLFVSRGGAEVSALISRANDYPGNFSHVALLYVDSATHQPYFIEAHIEKGVAIATAESYLKDKKLRFMVLRPNRQLPAIHKDSLLPHHAAAYAYRLAQQKHIPYDFEMDYFNDKKMFCSEVGSNAYQHFGVQLWQSNSTISSKGVVQWMSDFGVKHFVTQMPSDLEYDPQLQIVAEWINPETLLKDHLDNAVMDALITEANKGVPIGYNIWKLPIARCIKAWCFIKNSLGYVGMIPEGMDATTALRNEYFVDWYNRVRTQTSIAIQQFQQEKKYMPPYWAMVKMAEANTKVK
ncbi:MAG: YiiX/YebB-like N1pC/P60 family cysteine hydrolase [Ferruginibacter sp.]